MPDDPTEVGEIAITGQRRAAPEFLFPVHSYPLPEGLEHDNEEVGGEGTAGSICDDPALREEWDKDAAAAAAKAAFEAAAAGRGEQLGHREQTSVIHRGAEGETTYGPVTPGPIGTGSASFDFTGINLRDVVGIIHNHPGGSQRPSGPDWAILDDLKLRVTNAGGDPSAVRMYIVAPTYTAGNPNPNWRIFVYDDRNRTGGETGPEVNPDGVPC